MLPQVPPQANFSNFPVASAWANPSISGPPSPLPPASKHLHLSAVRLLKNPPAPAGTGLQLQRKWTIPETEFPVKPCAALAKEFLAHFLEQRSPGQPKPFERYHLPGDDFDAVRAHPRQGKRLVLGITRSDGIGNNENVLSLPA